MRRALVLVAYMASCHGDESPPTSATTTKGDDRVVHASAAVLAAAGVKVEPANLEKLSGIIEVSGELGADPDRIAEIASPVAGRLEAVKLDLGRLVKRGDPVATVLAPELGHARAESVAKRVQATAARANAERQIDLRAHGVASEKDTVNARAQADTLEAEARAAEGLLDALGTGGGISVSTSTLVLRAPRAGRVIKRDAIVGQPVAPTQILGTIADLDEVWFLARVFERDLDRVRVGRGVEVRLNAYPTHAYTGTVAYVDQQIDPRSRTVTARIVLDNKDGSLRLGLFGVARLAGDPTAAAVVVLPRAAVIELEGRSNVFVQTTPGVFERREVVIGPASGDRVAITSGLEPGAPVVTVGAFTLRSILLRSTLEDAE
jgi:cobalt-zinc-cadmium efflux system membrane fusion protein